MEKLHISTNLQVSSAPKEVFEAIVDPHKMSNYFIAESSGRMEEGAELEWKFPEFEEWTTIKVVQITPEEYISFQWEGSRGYPLLVEITLIGIQGNSTLVKITEKEMENNEAGIKWLAQNTEGWANFLACLKAYMEHGINLRKGGFDFMKR